MSGAYEKTKENANLAWTVTPGIAIVSGLTAAGAVGGRDSMFMAAFSGAVGAALLSTGWEYTWNRDSNTEMKGPIIMGNAAIGGGVAAAISFLI